MSTVKRSVTAAFVAVTTLFFAWGFITSLIDPLIASVRAIFGLSYTESMLTQFAFFMAYGVVSIPGAALIARMGYGRSIILSLLAMLAGCLFIPVATSLQQYALVLVALFVIASGITVLQVAANPLAAVLGVQERTHFRRCGGLDRQQHDLSPGPARCAEYFAGEGGENGFLLLAGRDAGPLHRQRAADPDQGAGIAGGIRGRQCRLVPGRLPGDGLCGRGRGNRGRFVQFDHVSDHFHHYARA